MALEQGSGSSTRRKKKSENNPAAPPVRKPTQSNTIQSKKANAGQATLWLDALLDVIGSVNPLPDDEIAQASIIEDEMDDYRDMRGGMPDIGRAMEEAARQLGLEPLGQEPQEETWPPDYNSPAEQVRRLRETGVPDSQIPNPGWMPSLMQGNFGREQIGDIGDSWRGGAYDEELTDDLHGLPLEDHTREWTNEDIFKNWPNMNANVYEPSWEDRMRWEANMPPHLRAPGAQVPSEDYPPYPDPRGFGWSTDHQRTWEEEITRPWEGGPMPEHSMNMGRYHDILPDNPNIPGISGPLGRPAWEQGWGPRSGELSDRTGLGPQSEPGFRPENWEEYPGSPWSPSANFGYQKPIGGASNVLGLLPPGQERIPYMEQINAFNPIHWIEQALEQGAEPDVGPEWGAAGGLSLLDLLPVILRMAA